MASSSAGLRLIGKGNCVTHAEDEGRQPISIHSSQTNQKKYTNTHTHREKRALLRRLLSDAWLTFSAALIEQVSFLKDAML
ncbi:UNVERIFIED_CONTAM: hypothetical protein FKN15_071142 [Acipenser sinensis]